MAIKTFTTGEVLTASDTNTYLANSGLTYISTTTVTSNVASVTVSNCFSSTYDNYRIIVLGKSSAGGSGSLKMQLNNATGSTYLMGGVYFTFGSATVNGYGPAANTTWTDAFAFESDTSNGSMDIFNPNNVRRTTATANSIKSGAGGATEGHYMMNFLETSTSQHTGFTLTPVSAQISTATITVYGYRKA